MSALGIVLTMCALYLILCAIFPRLPMIPFQWRSDPPAPLSRMSGVFVAVLIMMFAAEPRCGSTNPSCFDTTWPSGVLSQQF